MPPKDTHGLLGEPGAAQEAGTAGKVKKVDKKTFNASIGHGSASGGDQQGYGASGDPSITYKQATGWAKVLPKTGKFSTADHVGKQPLNYEYGSIPEDY